MDLNVLPEDPLSLEQFFSSLHHMDDHSLLSDLIEESVIRTDKTMNDKTMVKKRTLACKQCSKTFVSRLAVILHTRAEHKLVKHHECPICKQSFRTIKARNGHMRMHGKKMEDKQKETKVKCPLCDRKFTHKVALMIHMRCHSNQKPFKCNNCNKYFYTSNARNGHMRSHKVKTIKFRCELCTRSFLSETCLLRHKELHQSGKTLQCKFCSREFLTSNQLNAHMRVHTSQKSFDCDECMESFRDQTALAVHKAKHSGKELFSCEICGKVFAEYWKRNGHMQIHSVKAPRKCKICDKEFTRPNSLRLHMNVHTGDKPYKCKICQRGFTQPYTVKSHTLKVHSTQNANKKIPSKKKTADETCKKKLCRCHISDCNKSNLSQKKNVCQMKASQKSGSSKRSIQTRNQGDKKQSRSSVSKRCAEQNKNTPFQSSFQSDHSSHDRESSKQLQISETQTAISMQSEIFRTLNLKPVKCIEIRTVSKAVQCGNTLEITAASKPVQCENTLEINAASKPVQCTLEITAASKPVQCESTLEINTASTSGQNENSVVVKEKPYQSISSQYYHMQIDDAQTHRSLPQVQEETVQDLPRGMPVGSELQTEVWLKQEQNDDFVTSKCKCSELQVTRTQDEYHTSDLSALNRHVVKFENQEKELLNSPDMYISETPDQPVECRSVSTDNSVEPDYCNNPNVEERSTKDQTSKKTVKNYKQTDHGKGTKEKIFTCEFCEKAFKSKSSLNKHLRIHWKDLPDDI